MQLTGAEIIIECLKEQGVDTIFGYPGGAILNVYDALYKHRDEIHHVLTSHEQGASHAADGYARSTGKVGVCFATSGPGATNLVTGIATAYMDSVPMVAITCNVTVPLLGKDSFQEVDIAGITRPITKHNFIVKDVESLADTLRRAFRIASTGRPAPVLVDVTKDVTAAKTQYKKDKSASAKNQANAKDIDDLIVSDQATIDHAVSMIERSKKPFIFVGGGAVIGNAADEVREFAKLIDAPVCDSLMGKGAFDGTSKAYTGMLGMHGTKTSNFGVSECDLLIALGTRFSDRVLGNPKKFAKQARILQIDIDPAEINKNIVVYESVIGDVKAVLTKINSKLKKQKHPEWMKHIADYKKKYPVKLDTKTLNGPMIIDELYRQTKGDAFITTEVGQHQMWAAQYYSFSKPRRLITSGGLGTMGYGLGAAIGVAIANPGQKVFNVAGDGCFRMNMNEMATAVRNNLPIVEIIIDNRVLGMVRQWQDLFYEKRYSETVLDDATDYVKIAEAFGAKAYRVSTPAAYKKALTAALKADGPVLIDCVIDQDDKVWPMVAPGAPISECFTGDDI